MVGVGDVVLDTDNFETEHVRKSVNQKNGLQIHMKKQSGEWAHVSPYCEYAFSTIDISVDWDCDI